MQTFTDLTTNPLLIAFIILCIAIIILSVIVILIYLKLRKFLIGIDSKNIEDSLSFAKNNINDLQAFRKDLEQYLSSVEKRLRKSVQSIKTVRFNPFKGTGGGGNQSFATSFLNEEGDGVVISSLYSRDHVSVFSKPIKDKKSEYELTDEEKEALL